LVSPERYVAAAQRAARTTSRAPAAIAQLYTGYEHEKRRRGLVDFDDLLAGCADALERDPAFAAAQQWRFRHLFVDEFQDVSPLQLRLLRAWLGERPDLCVVGDPDQAIYGFAGAEAGYLRNFARQFSGGQVVQLDRNYRSTPCIVAAAEAVLADGGGPRPARLAVRTNGPAPTIVEYDTDEAEAAGVARQLRAAHATHGEWSRLAVLYRTNAQSARLEEACSQAGIPVQVRGDSRFLERPEVRAGIDALRAAAKAKPHDRFGQHVGTLEAGADRLVEERREHTIALVRLASEYVEIDGDAATVEGFLAHLTTVLHQEPPEDGGDAVQLLTFHRAKGLEFHSVFIVGLERGLVPISHAATPASRAEERRLLFVALSRAEHELHLSCARQRTLGSRIVPRVRSPWLAPIEASMTDGPSERDAVLSSRSTLRETRASLAAVRPGTEHPGGSDGDADPKLLTALVDWRRKLAKASGVPAYVIFHDATLRAVATSKPGHHDALLELPGIGPVKAQRHGDAVLDLVRRHAS
jgi:DNA helicase-2/ATP-dependent DNA helicase PcrA